jgi:3-hydroxyacyl-CoA dehydrogenase
VSETTEVVSRRTVDAVAVVTIDNPPVNVLSAAVRAGLLAAVGAAEADAEVVATVIACAGRTFVAGADVREFGLPPIEPVLPVVLAAIEAATKPVVAAIHGTALGGGFELALACHGRLARADARVGLPEINLGVIPGGGGTQRFPRLVGVERALDLILSGRPIEAATARDWGALDAIVEADGDLVAAAIALARALSVDEMAPRPARDRDPPGEGALAVLARRRAELLARDPDEIAGLAAIEAMRVGLADGFAAGLVEERRAFLALRDGPRAAAKREAFFAARRTSKS